MHEPVVLFGKFISAYLHQIAPEIMLLLVNNLLEKKHHKKSRRAKLWQRALFVICNRVATLHSCYMKNILVFSQSGARDFLCLLLHYEQHTRESL